MTVAFHAWNPFQVFQIANVAREYRDSVLLLEKRASMDFDRVFDRSVLDTLGLPVVQTTAKKIAQSDGEFAAIVCQTPIRYYERLEKTKRVAMQYSITKERHQHGAWRALCDLNLLYGQYSLDRCAPWGPCRMIGNPRFEAWFDGSLDPEKLQKMRESLDPGKKTVLYQPTWADLSSVPMYQHAVGNLSEAYNVIAKVHHNTDALELDRKTTLGTAGLGTIFGASDDSLYLLACSDLVMSDYSGAIFDAINVGKPVVLLQHEPENLDTKKFGLESIEYSRRDDIGPVAGTPDALREVVDSAFAYPDRYRDKNLQIKAECFALETGCGATGAEALEDLLNGRLAPRSFHQIYLRDELIAGRQASEELRTLLSKSTAPLKLKKTQFAKTRVRANGGLSIKTKAVSLLTPFKTRVVSAIVKLIERKVLDAEDRLPLWFALAKGVLSADKMIRMSKRLAVHGKTRASLLIAESASARRSSHGLTHFVTVAGRAKDYDLLHRAKKHLERMPPLRRARSARNAIRISEALGRNDAGRYTNDAEIILSRHIENPATFTPERFLSLRSLIQQRSVTYAERLASETKLRADQRAKITVEIDILKDRCGKWYDLINMATENAKHPGRWCWKNGSAWLTEKADGPKVEFLVPTYFANVVSGSSPDAHARICGFLRSVLDAVEKSGIVIVPKHQYWLHIANPTGNMPAISYHTTGNRDGWLHLKDAAIPGYYRLDMKGYAGFSSFADYKSLPIEAMAAPIGDVSRAWAEVQERIVLAKASKYEQSDQPVDLPDPGYIFFAMQMLDDTVATLAWIPILDGLRMTVKEAERQGKKVVIKRHPMCKREDVSRALSSMRASPSVVITDASIHDLIPHADRVVTVNSGVGFEALLYGKPVITMGASEYGVVTTQCRSENDLVLALNSVMDVDIDAIKRFVWLYLDKSVKETDASKVADWIKSPSGEVKIFEESAIA